MLVALLDENLKYAFVSETVTGLSVDDVIGRPAWAFCDHDEAERMKTLLSRCQSLGEIQRYLITSQIHGMAVTYAVVAQRVLHFVMCIAQRLPPAVRDLSEADLTFLRAIGQQKSQKLVAAALGVSHTAVSNREIRLRSRIGLEPDADRLQLIEIGQALAHR